MMLEDLRTTIVAIEKSSMKWGIHFDIARKEEKLPSWNTKWVSRHSGTIRNKRRR